MTHTHKAAIFVCVETELADKASVFVQARGKYFSKNPKLFRKGTKKILNFSKLF